MNKDPFSYYRFGFTESSAIRGTVNSGYRLAITIGILGILLTLMISGIVLMSASPQKRVEVFEDIKWKVIVMIALFSIPTIVGVIMGVVNSVV